MTTKDDKQQTDINSISSKIKRIGNPSRASAKGKRKKGKAKYKNRLREVKNIETSPENKSPEIKTPDVNIDYKREDLLNRDKHFRIVHKANTIKTTKWIGTSENKTKRELEDESKLTEGSYLRTPVNKSKNTSISKDAIILPTGLMHQNGKWLDVNYNPYSNNTQKSVITKNTNDEATTLVCIGSSSKIVKPKVLYSNYNPKSNSFNAKSKENVKIKVDYCKSQELPSNQMFQIAGENPGDEIQIVQPIMIK